MKDEQKLVAAIEAILKPHIASQATFVFVHGNTFYNSCALSYMRKKYFHDDVSEQLSCSTLCKNYGEWLYTEYGDGMYVFVRMTRPGESKPGSTVKLLVDRGVAAEHAFNN